MSNIAALKDARNDYEVRRLMLPLLHACMCVHVRVCTSMNDVLLGVRTSDAIVQYLAELRTGLHRLREKMGRWVGLSEKNARVHVPELLKSIGNALHMALRCTLHAEIRMHHVDLLCGV